MWQAAQTFEPTYPLAPYTVEANKISPTIPHTLWRRLSAQCHLVFPDSGICLWGGPLACAGRPARLVDNSARSEERGWEPRADGAPAPPKLSDIGLSASSVETPLEKPASRIWRAGKLTLRKL